MNKRFIGDSSAKSHALRHAPWLLASLLFLAPAGHALDDICAINSCKTCNCYWSSDCGSNQSCNYSSGCTKSGKKDGTCKAAGADGGFTDAQMPVVAQAIDLWFQAYAMPTGEEGLPNEETFKRIKSLELSAESQRRVRFAVFNAIDVALGFDFVHPRGDCQEYDERCLGIFRIGIEPEGMELLETVRSAFTKGMQTRDPMAVREPLQVFWERTAKFQPHHTGRCYPHGHPRFEYKSPAECQVDELSRILEDLLASGPAKGSVDPDR